MEHLVKIGDFFESATSAQPVNPRPLKFTAVCDEPTLPGGKSNRSGGQVKAVISACFILVGGQGTREARDDTWRALKREDERTKQPIPAQPGDFEIECKYQILSRAIRQLVRREGERVFAGDPMFEAGAKQMRDLVVFDEMERLWEMYKEYVAQEHPRDLDERRFRDAQGGDQGALPPSPDGLLEDEGLSPLP